MKNFSDFLPQSRQEGNILMPKPDFSKFQFWGLYFSASSYPPCGLFIGSYKFLWRNQKDTQN
ncbi:unnamed protein product [Paramecium octaurelia]|uniref:Uncharacterized protein n=1 Tax=Paramecium octaurelia TaxID=43137 RepID=A0A8S1YC66_PAROT|nr:unnamed protein product [Paramecium octaurelia]